MGLRVKGLLAWLRAPDVVPGSDPEAVGGEGMEAGHQELSLIEASVYLLRFLLAVFPDVDLVAQDGVVIVIERHRPGQQHRPDRQETLELKLK